MAFKPPANLPDYTKLTTSLNASGVQSWNPELHSILKQLISSAQQSQDAITGVPAGSPVGVIDIGGGSGSSGSEIEYLGDIALPKVYNDGDIVVGTDGIAYLCTKDGTTTVPTVWPGGGGLTGPPGPQGPPGTIGPHHTTHEPGGSDALVNAAWTNLSNTFTKFQRFKKDVTNSPQLALDGVGGVNTSLWGISTVNGGTQLHFIAFDDDLNSGSSAIQLFRNGNVIITGVLNVSNNILTGGNILVNKVLPQIQVQYIGNNVIGRISQNSGSVGRIDLSENLSFNGTDLLADDTSKASAQYTQIDGFHQFFIAPAGPNPRTSALTNVATIASSGIRSTTDYYEKGRSVPVGHWTDFTPVLTTDVGTATIANLVTAAYTLVGKTMTIGFHFNLTTSGGTYVRFPTPGGFVSARTITNAISNNTGYCGIASAPVGQSFVYFFKNASGATPWPINDFVTGSVTFSIV